MIKVNINDGIVRWVTESEVRKFQDIIAQETLHCFKSDDFYGGVELIRYSDCYWMILE